MYVRQWVGSAAVLLGLASGFVVTTSLPAAAEPVPADTYTLKLGAATAQAGTPDAVDSASGSVEFIGNATVLIRYQGMTILTDPNFIAQGERLPFAYATSSARLTNPAVPFDQLPPIDLVILSHMHEDHFDKLVQQRLDRNTPIVSTREASAALKRLGFRQRFALSDWDRLEVSKGAARLRITAVPARHGPLGSGLLMPQMMGSVLDFGAHPDQPDYRMYISGDTVLYKGITTIAQRFPGIDLALLHLGGTRIKGLVKVSMDGADGVEMMRILQAKKALPVHFADYDVQRSSLAEFTRAASQAGLAERVQILAPGARLSFSPQAH